MVDAQTSRGASQLSVDGSSRAEAEDGTDPDQTSISMTRRPPVFVANS